MNETKTCSEKTKLKMAETLKDLMRSTSFEKITISDITDACGIHRQTFYYHFQDRHELLDWLLYNELLKPFIEGFTFEDVYERFDVLFLTMYNDRKFYQNALKINYEDFTRYISKIATEDFTKLVHRLAIEHGIVSEDSSNSIFMAEFIGYGISGIIHNWSTKGMKETPAEMTERIQYIIDCSKKIISDEA